MKKIVAVLLALVLCAWMFVGCSQSKPIIGIIQFGSHGSLNNCYEGIIEGLKENGVDLDAYEVQYLNSNFDPSVSQTQANTLVNKNAKVIIAIATPSAVAAATAAADAGIPVVYCAVTDASVMANYENITGASDVPNFDKQLELITSVLNKKDLKIGVLYSTDESSSPYQITALKKAAKTYNGMEILDSAVSDITTIDSKVNALLEQNVDCFVNILDNTVVGKLETNILPLTDEAGVPVFGSEIEQVKVGCAASASIEYVNVGKLAGESAAQILNGKKASDIGVRTITEPFLCYNSKVCNKLGLTVSAKLDAIDVVK